MIAQLSLFIIGQNCQKFLLRDWATCPKWCGAFPHPNPSPVRGRGAFIPWFFAEFVVKAQGSPSPAFSGRGGWGVRECAMPPSIVKNLPLKGGGWGVRERYTADQSLKTYVSASGDHAIIKQRFDTYSCSFSFFSVSTAELCLATKQLPKFLPILPMRWK